MNRAEKTAKRTLQRLRRQNRRVRYGDYLTSRSDGTLLGRRKDQPVYAGPGEHVAIVAPTGMGKTVAYSIPICLSWAGNLVVLDPKGEIYRATSAFRSRHQPVYRWAPDGGEHSWNPLATDLANEAYAESFVRRLQRGNTDYFANSARSLILALRHGAPDLGTLWVAAASPGWQSALSRLATTSRAKAAFEDFLQKAGAEQSGVRGSLTETLAPFGAPGLHTATSGTGDFTWNGFTGTVYLQVDPTEQEAYKPILRGLLELALTYAFKTTQPFLLLAEECSFLRDLPALATALVYGRGSNTTVTLVGQTLDHLPPDALGNCRHVLIAPSRDKNTADYVERVLGKTEVRTRSINFHKGGTSKTESEALDQSFSSELLAAWPQEQLLWVRPRERPLLLSQARFYHYQELRDRLGERPTSARPLQPLNAAALEDECDDPTAAELAASLGDDEITALLAEIDSDQSDSP